MTMKTSILGMVTGFALVAPAWCEDDPNAANLAALEKAAKTFVEAFNKADADALSKSFLPDGEMTLSDGTVVVGREAIKDFYEGRFADEEKPKGAVEVGSVRFVTPGVAIENGTFHVTAGDGEVSSQEYIAVQVKQEDGSWLTASVRDQAGDEALPSEKMAGLDWIIGDWVIQRNGVETTLSFEWSKVGPYIEGTGNITRTDGSTDQVTLRLGWDNARKGFVSWSFDGSGGFARSDWTANGNLRWLLRSQGVTAEGESNQYLQTCEVDPSRQSFKWVIRDHTIGDEVQPDIELTAVKRPPAGKVAEETKTESTKQK